MECNRDDAFKAREVAVNKMQNNDFEGARKMVEKAKRLFPELENTAHLLSVCNVHISAQSKVFGTEKDWYGILQVERKADEITIKKQYRKLALVLHPDKNKFPGAEAAFKLVGEANMVLSDKGRRTSYDAKCRVSVPKATKPPPPPHQENRSRGANRPRGAHNTSSAAPNNKISGVNQNQATKPIHSNRQLVSFWTTCPFCGTNFLYLREYVNRALRCQNCAKPFIAHDKEAQGTPVGSNRGQHVFPQQQQAPNQRVSHQQAPKQQDFKVDPQTHPNNGVNPSQRNVRSDQTAGGGLKANGKDDGPKDNAAAMPKGSGTSRNNNRKRGRKSVDGCSESFNTATSTESEDVIEESGTRAASSLNDDSRRRSARQKQQVSYSENLSDDDLTSPRKRSRMSKSSAEGKEKEAAAAPEKVKEESVSHREEEPVKVDPSAQCSSDLDDPVVYECPEPEFNNFDKDKEENGFSVGQIWACYDTIDSMPRFYAEVRKVFHLPQFKLRISWLEPDPETEEEIEWVNKGLPVACGKFVRGDTEDTSDGPMFSHWMLFDKVRRTYKIYPQKGEIWAVYKDWDSRWSSDPNNHKPYKLEVVEVLSSLGDFDYVNNGIRVGYMEKVKGFLSLFQKKANDHGGISTFLIPSVELFRFSHRIPSFQMTGAERNGVPIGSVELDPASLPPEFNEVCQHDEVKMASGSMDGEVKGSCPKEKPESTRDTEKISTPKKADFHRESFEVRRSPRGFMTNPKQINGTTEDNSTCLSDEKMCVKVDSNSSHKVPQEVFYDFNKEKSVEKFQPGQIWAVYKDGLPNKYAQIKRIHNSPFELQVQLLEVCTPTQPLCCGLFKLKTWKTLFSPSSFSHMVEAKAINRSVFEIYPKKGEIWAVYRNWTHDFSQSELKNCEYDIVEVVNDTLQSTDVSSLVQVAGYKSTFRAQNRQRSNADGLVIPRAELRRFSHQIPAFKLTEEKEGSLRGFWELDPAALLGRLPENKIESVAASENTNTPQKPDFPKEKFELRRSPRELKSTTTNSRQSNGMKTNSSRPCLAAENNIYINMDTSSPNKLSEESFHNFSKEKGPANFEVGQVWATYEDGLPKRYVQIKKIECSPVRLHVQSLELCTSTKSLCCGIFKLKNGVMIHLPESFSHLVKAKVIIQNIFEIYPKKGEIWAMYRNWKADTASHSCIGNCEYDIVEVLEDTEQFTEAFPVERVGGFKSVFSAPRRQRSNPGDLMVIPRAEVGRFSHQIPAIKLDGEKVGRLVGSWELDPAAVPGKV